MQLCLLPLTFIVVEPTIVGSTNNSVSFLSIRPDEEYLGIIEDFMMFVGSQFVHKLLHGHFGRHGRRHSAAGTSAFERGRDASRRGSAGIAAASSSSAAGSLSGDGRRR